MDRELELRVKASAKRKGGKEKLQEETRAYRKR